MNPSQLQLREIHLPDPVGWWPFAPGWWILMILVGAVIAVLYWGWRRFKQFATRRATLREFKSLTNNPHLTEAQRVKNLSVLLRRACISAYPHEKVAALTGDKWLSFLDTHLNDGRFSGVVGKLLVEAPYRETVECSVDALYSLCEEWIRALPQVKKW